MKGNVMRKTLVFSQDQRRRMISIWACRGIVVLLMFSVLACAWMPTAPTHLKPSPSVEKMPVEYLKIPKQACPGESVTLVLQTLPGSKCEMVFSYPVGDGLKTRIFETQVTDTEGVCSWEWKIPSDASPGTAGFRNDVRLSDEVSRSLAPKDFEIVRCEE